MKKFVILLFGICFSSGLWAQENEQTTNPFVSDNLFSETQNLKFKPRYAGTSLDAGFMFMPRYGSAFYVTPKLMFQATPRLFVNTGIGVVQYSLLPSQMKQESSPQQRTGPTGAFIFAEGMYLLNERWSVNGSVMKYVTPSPMRGTTPYSLPTQSMHFGVDYKITPNISVGARIGYSNGGSSNNFYPY